jgi:hypothetical protein
LGKRPPKSAGKWVARSHFSVATSQAATSSLCRTNELYKAWRVVDWIPGVYSIVKFELTEQGSGTKIIFDHTGFPEGKAQHLAEGWKANYWEPLQKYLAS